MSIGSGIGLIVVGAILTFAITVELGWIDLDIVGSILMGAGLVIFVLGIISATRKRRVVQTVSVAADPVTGQQVTERRTTGPL